MSEISMRKHVRKVLKEDSLITIDKEDKTEEEEKED